MTELMLKAQIALTAKQVGDPRYDQLVEALMQRLSMGRADVEEHLVALSKGLLT